MIARKPNLQNHPTTFHLPRNNRKSEVFLLIFYPLERSRSAEKYATRAKTRIQSHLLNEPSEHLNASR